jgi:O-methyltransferase
MLKRYVKGALSRLGYDLVRRGEGGGRYPADFSAEDIRVIESVRAYTMTSPERMFCLMRAVEHLVAAHVPGAFVECGVWRGGSMMIVAQTLSRLGIKQAELYLYDTYEGMTAPSEADVRHDDASAKQRFQQLAADGEKWCYASLSEVERNLAGTGYPKEHMHFVKGAVEETIPGTAPASIALLRLDTDWYESTKHELVHLFPRISPGGILIIDDYGHWKGSRKATDEYFADQGIVPFLQRVDYTSRLFIKAAALQVE